MKSIDGQVRLVHLQTDNFGVHDEQTVNGFRKIVWASIFCLIFFVKRQHIYIYIYLNIFIHIYIHKRCVSFETRHLKYLTLVFPTRLLTSEDECKWF
jgi:hypothetical protein